LQFKIGQSNTDVAVGLSNDVKGFFTNLCYALWLRADGSVQVYESGDPVGQSRPYQTDDVFSIDLIAADGLELVMYTQNRQPISPNWDTTRF